MDLSSYDDSVPHALSWAVKMEYKSGRGNI